MAEGAGERAARRRVLGEPLPDWLTKATASWKFRRLPRPGGGLEGRGSGERLVVGVAIGIKWRQERRGGLGLEGRFQSVAVNPGRLLSISIGC